MCTVGDSYGHFRGRSDGCIVINEVYRIHCVLRSKDKGINFQNCEPFNGNGLTWLSVVHLMLECTNRLTDTLFAVSHRNSQKAISGVNLISDLLFSKHFLVLIR